MLAHLKYDEAKAVSGLSECGAKRGIVEVEVYELLVFSFLRRTRQGPKPPL
jgi:hypothetical protein